MHSAIPIKLILRGTSQIQARENHLWEVLACSQHPESSLRQETIKLLGAPTQVALPLPHSNADTEKDVFHCKESSDRL